jgi:hypothetical protein
MHAAGLLVHPSTETSQIQISKPHSSASAAAFEDCRAAALSFLASLTAWSSSLIFFLRSVLVMSHCPFPFVKFRSLIWACATGSLPFPSGPFRMSLCVGIG